MKENQSLRPPSASLRSTVEHLKDNSNDQLPLSHQSIRNLLCVLPGTRLFDLIAYVGNLGDVKMQNAISRGNGDPKITSVTFKALKLAASMAKTVNQMYYLALNPEGRQINNSSLGVTVAVAVTDEIINFTQFGNTEHLLKMIDLCNTMHKQIRGLRDALGQLTRAENLEPHEKVVHLRKVLVHLEAWFEMQLKHYVAFISFAEPEKLKAAWAKSASSDLKSDFSPHDQNRFPQIEWTDRQQEQIKEIMEKLHSTDDAYNLQNDSPRGESTVTEAAVKIQDYAALLRDMIKTAGQNSPTHETALENISLEVGCIQKITGQKAERVSAPGLEPSDRVRKLFSNNKSSFFREKDSQERVVSQEPAEQQSRVTPIPTR